VDVLNKGKVIPTWLSQVVGDMVNCTWVIMSNLVTLKSDNINVYDDPEYSLWESMFKI